MKHATPQFDFSVQPKVIAFKPKFRTEESFQTNNLMNDPRIFRGNTHAALSAIKKSTLNSAPKKTIKEITTKFNRKVINFNTGFQPLTPRPVKGRDHFTCQTEPFIETLKDKPVQYEKECQTDLFLDRPEKRLMDRKMGNDMSTQIRENDKDLFDFNYEVQPILEALLGKIFEISQMELFQEEHLKKKQKQKNQYEEKKHSKIAELQRLEANGERWRKETEMRKQQDRASKEQEKMAEKKVIGRIISKHCLKNIRENTETILQFGGFFRTPLQCRLLEKFVPWVYKEIENELRVKNFCEKTLEQMCGQGEKQILKESEEAIKEEDKRREQMRRQQERRQLQLIAQKKKEQKQKQKEKQYTQDQQEDNDI